MDKFWLFFRKTLKAILWAAIIIVILFLIVAALIQIPAIQNKLIHYATSVVSDKTHTRVEIKSVSIAFPKSVVAEGVFLEDLHKDTLLYAGRTKINIALFDLLSSNFSVSSVSFDEVYLNLHTTSEDSLLNLNFLLTTFSDTAAIQTTVRSQSTSKWTFSIDKINLNNIRFRYDDEYGGMHVAASLGNLKLNMDEVDFRKAIYRIDDLLVDNLDANVLVEKTATASEKETDDILPKIKANKIRINNSTFCYVDATGKQSIIASTSSLVLKNGSVDLQKKLVSLDKLTLSESKIQYDNSLAYLIQNKHETRNTFDVNHLNYNHLTLEATNFNLSLRSQIIVSA